MDIDRPLYLHVDILQHPSIHLEKPAVQHGNTGQPGA